MTIYTKPLLSDEDLIELTEAKQVSGWIAWLRQNKVAFTLSKLGRPRTTWGLVEKALSVRGEGKDDYKPPAKSQAA